MLIYKWGIIYKKRRKPCIYSYNSANAARLEPITLSYSSFKTLYTSMKRLVSLFLWSEGNQERPYLRFA